MLSAKEGRGGVVVLKRSRPLKTPFACRRSYPLWTAPERRFFRSMSGPESLERYIVYNANIK
jgi:hypothetical protein